MHTYISIDNIKLFVTLQTCLKTEDGNIIYVALNSEIMYSTFISRKNYVLIYSNCVNIEKFYSKSFFNKSSKKKLFFNNMMIES